MMDGTRIKMDQESEFGQFPKGIARRRDYEVKAYSKTKIRSGEEIRRNPLHFDDGHSRK